MTRDEFMMQLLYPDGILTSDPERIAEWQRLKWEIGAEEARGKFTYYEELPPPKSAH